jgi:hypothetical protein
LNRSKQSEVMSTTFPGFTSAAHPASACKADKIVREICVKGSTLGRKGRLPNAE